MSLFKRLSTEASNACQDVYSNWILGDDAGKSMRLTLVVRPQSTRLDLGLTFLEINGRAYVKTVLEGSAAQAAGILPQDAVQYATLFRSEWLYSSSSASQSSSSASNIPKTSSSDDSLALQYALDLEAKGMRISYDELRKLLAKGLDPTQSAFLSPASSSSTTWSGPPIPSNVCVPIPMEEQEHRPNSPFTAEKPRPVVLVFRRTRQRSNNNLPPISSFRLDDECDIATHLVQRLAPTADMQAPPPDPWEELLHDGTDWLLGRQQQQRTNHKDNPELTTATITTNLSKNNNHNNDDNDDDDDDKASIPLDAFEQERAHKLARLRATAIGQQLERRTYDDVEAATIRSMIQKAVGLAFVRASKVVLGVSLHAGSGIVVARLSDGTWSAPSAIGTWGLGLGLQFGVEVAEYIFILQTQEALEHFRHGGSFTVGGNIGVAAAGMGREAYGAASVGGVCGNVNTTIQDDDDEYNETSSPRSLAIAPIVAYAKSQGLYIGVSLEGSRIFSRDDVNSRAYKFETGRDVSAKDILSGTVPTPPEAEGLYAALHSVEFTHEMSCLPRPPELLRLDSANAWQYDQSTLGGESSTSLEQQQQQPFDFLARMTPEESQDCEAFETQFKNFMYGGVSVQRLMPAKETRSGRTVKERRTLWLMLPEVGSLRLGFVSKLSDGEQECSNKRSTQQARRMMEEIGTVGSEDLTLDSALNTKDGSTIGQIRPGNVQLSTKHSVALTDVTILSQEPLVPIRLKGEDKMEHLRVISVQDVSGTSLLFLANNFREAELLVCGLKLLLERETTRLGVRGGLPLTAFGGKHLEGAMSPAAARGFRDVPATTSSRRSRDRRSSDTGYTSSDIGEDSLTDAAPENSDAESRDRRRWGNVPGRNYMRDQAHISFESRAQRTRDQVGQHYVHGQQIVRELAKNVRLPLPLPLCRVLLLDCTSPVVKTWERDRGDTDFEKSPWVFPPGSSRALERHSSEHQLIASGSMKGAQRTSSFNRQRYGSVVRLTEAHAVEADDLRTVAFTVEEKNPRRGFSVCVRVILSAQKENACIANVFAELRPVGKDMVNQSAIHRAFLMVVDEIKARYGSDDKGLLAGFLNVVDDMASKRAPNGRAETASRNSLSRPFRRTDPAMEEKKGDSAPAPAAPKATPSRPSNKANSSGFVSFEDMLKTGRESPETIPAGRPSTPSLQHQIPEADPAKRVTAHAPSALPNADNFLESEEKQVDKKKKKKEAVMIEVKPLPKIRLSLMPSPREEDEEEDSDSPAATKSIRKKKSSRLRRSSSSVRKSSRSKKALNFA